MSETKHTPKVAGHQYSVQVSRSEFLSDVSRHETQEEAELAATYLSLKDPDTLYEVWDETENEGSGEPLSGWENGIRAEGLEY